MLSLEDCIAFSGLTRDQLDAVACYKHLPPIIAAEWAETVLDRPQGCNEVERILEEEITFACDHHPDCVSRWRCGLAEFRHDHPN